MRFTRLVLVVSSAWLLALGMAAGAIRLWGFSWPGLAAAGAAMVSALVLSLLAALAADRAQAERLAALGRAVGLPEAEAAVSLEAIIASLCARLERANHFKSAFSGLEHPAALLASSGEVLGASRGVQALRPHAPEAVEALLGAGAPGEPEPPDRVTVGDAGFIVRRHPLADDRVLVELTPAGQYIADDDLAAFTAALTGGQTGFRFAADAVARSPVLQALQEGIETIDAGVTALAQLLAGEPPPTGLPAGDAGFVPLVRALGALLEALEDERAAAVAQAAAVEGKLAAAVAAIDRYRSSVARLAEHADRTRSGAREVRLAVEQGQDRLQVIRTLEREALRLAAEATDLSVQVEATAGGPATAGSEIERLMSTMEDVGFRTNLLALNAADEAARPGEKRASFAVVADEVRRLARASQKTAKEIRALLEREREDPDAGPAAAERLKHLLAGLGGHLENLSNETDMITMALDQGHEAAGQFESAATAMGDEAARALVLPERRRA